MKIVFLQSYQGFGQKGDIKEVKDGFARNFLIPRGFAAPFTEKVQLELTAQKKAEEKSKEVQRKKTEELEKKLNGVTFKTFLKTGEKGEAFGSVSINDIVQLLKEKGIAIEKKQVLLEKHLKTFGTHEVILNLGEGANAKIFIEVSTNRS